MGKYFYQINGDTINKGQKVCSYDQWVNGNSVDFDCCIHQKGYLIFLKPDLIDLHDEYRGVDPYSTNSNINSPFHQRRIKCTIDLIKKHVTRKNPRILDLCCGQGFITNNIKLNYKESEVFGLDHSISAIDYASTNFKGINFLVADAYSSPFDDDFFDVVVCNNFFEHVPDPIIFIESVKRILSTNGLFIISTPSRYRLVNLIKILIGRRVSLISKHHVTEYSVGQVKEMFNFSDIDVVEVYSTPIKEKRLIYRIVKFIISRVIKIIGSHHSLEATVFFAATKKQKTYLK